MCLRYDGTDEIDVAMKKWFEEVGRTCVTEDLQKLSEFMEMCFNVEIHNKMQVTVIIVY